MKQRYTIKCLDASYTASSAYASAADQGKQAEEALELLHRLHPALQAILDAELQGGNKVVSASTGYPDPDSVSICLAKRFRTLYATSSLVAYELEKDPHYGYAGYQTTMPPRHSLLC